MRVILNIIDMKNVKNCRLLILVKSVKHRIGLIIQFIDKRPVLKDTIKFTFDRFIDML